MEPRSLGNATLNQDYASVPELILEAPLSRERNGLTIQSQLFDRIRAAILDGRLPAGCRLPGSRALAAELEVARNSVTAVYELLGVEGYIVLSRQGTRVAGVAIKQPLEPFPPNPERLAPPIAARARSVRVNEWGAGDATAFRPGVPALSHFPLAIWKRCLVGAIQHAGSQALGYGLPQGELALRTAISRHLAVARGVRCDPDQVIITEGAQEALTLCVRLLTDTGDTVWLEEPGYRGAQTAFACGDLQPRTVRVDADGILIKETDWATASPRLIYVTPSHQYPTGAVLTATRRLDLIHRARAHAAWIIEDDYDSEFRHSGKPIAAMQGLVPNAPVLYVGTFSKTLFPSLRIGFLVLPKVLLISAQPLLAETLRGGHRFEQLALATFIEAGHLSRHLRQMRRLYRSRRDALTVAIRQHLQVPHEVLGGDCGMHLTVRLPTAFNDKRIAAKARHFGMSPAPLSGFALNPGVMDNGLVLGYGNTGESRFEALIKKLSQIINEESQPA